MSDESDSLRPTVAAILRQQGNDRGAAIIEDNDKHDRADTIGFLRDELDAASNRADEMEGSADDLADQVRKLTERNKKLRADNKKLCDGIRSLAELASQDGSALSEYSELLDKIAADARKLLD